MSSPSFDVCVVGAGIIGSACAMECARSGLHVAVVEADYFGSGATSVAMGHIVVMDDSEAQFALTRYSQEIWNEFAPRLPGDVEYECCGTIWVAADDEEMVEVKRKHEFYTSQGVPTEVMDARGLRAAEPNLREGLSGGLLVPEDSVVYPPCAAQFFVDQACSFGADVYLGQAVAQVSDLGVTLQDGTHISSGVTVVAGGAVSPELVFDLNVRKRKGHLTITDRYPGFVHHQLVELGYLKSAQSSSSDSVAFNIQPRKTGQLLIDSSRQFGVEDAQIDSLMLRRMLQRAFDYMPGLAQLSTIRTWAGFRPSTPDNLPLIGPTHEGGRVFVATGHEGLGITTSLGTARILTDLILGRRSEIPVEPYLPTRPGLEADLV